MHTQLSIPHAILLFKIQPSDVLNSLAALQFPLLYNNKFVVHFYTVFFLFLFFIVGCCFSGGKIGLQFAWNSHLIRTFIGVVAHKFSSN